MQSGASSKSALLASKAVMYAFGYKDRSSFWQFVKTKGVPHIRFNSRRIMFDPQALNDWLSRRSSNGGVTLTF
jgi:hypothetical protein